MRHFSVFMMFAKKGDGRNVGRGGGKWVNLILFVSFPPSPTQSTFVSWPFKLICMTEKKFPICNNNFLRKIYFFKIIVWKYGILTWFKSWLLPSPPTMGVRNNVFLYGMWHQLGLKIRNTVNFEFNNLEVVEFT